MIRTKIDESLEAVHTHTHTHTHIQHLYKCVLSCYAMVESVYSTELYLTKISFDFCAKKSNKIEEIKKGNNQKDMRMDYIKNSLSFLCVKKT